MQMKYGELVDALFINMISNNVPMVIGDAGIGKSQLPKSVAKKFNEQGFETEIVTLFGSLLKEGELGGIPVPREEIAYIIKNTNEEVSKEAVHAEGKKLFTSDGKPVVRKRQMLNDYTTHVKLQRIIENGQKENFITILFIDELNRCENAVQQELMQLILENQINQTVLPDNCRIMAAGNPSQSDFADYQVVVMNEALKDRFFQYSLKADINSWLSWAMREESHMNKDIVDFIAEYPEFLHNLKIADDIKPTPRGWKMFSDSYEAILKYFPNDVEDKTVAVAIAKVGESAALSFIKFIRNRENPLIKPEEFFYAAGNRDDEESQYYKLLQRLKAEKVTRQHVIITRLLNYMDEHLDEFKNSSQEDKKKKAKENGYIDSLTYRFIDAIKLIPKDIMLGVAKTINDGDHDKLSRILLQYQDYLNLFFDTDRRLNSAMLY